MGLLVKNHQQPRIEKDQLTGVAATNIFSSAGTNQMALFEFLTDRDVTHLSGTDIRFNGRYQQVFVFPEFIYHFIYNLQYAVIALCDDPYILDDNHLAGTVNLGQFISERI